MPRRSNFRVRNSRLPSGICSEIMLAVESSAPCGPPYTSFTLARYSSGVDTANQIVLDDSIQYTPSLPSCTFASYKYTRRL